MNEIDFNNLIQQRHGQKSAAPYSTLIWEVGEEDLIRYCKDLIPETYVIKSQRIQ